MKRKAHLSISLTNENHRYMCEQNFLVATIYDFSKGEIKIKSYSELLYWLQKFYSEKYIVIVDDYMFYKVILANYELNLIQLEYVDYNLNPDVSDIEHVLSKSNRISSQYFSAKVISELKEKGYIFVEKEYLNFILIHLQEFKDFKVNITYQYSKKMIKLVKL